MTDRVVTPGWNKVCVDLCRMVGIDPDERSITRLVIDAKIGSVTVTVHELLLEDSEGARERVGRYRLVPVDDVTDDEGEETDGPTARG